VNEKGKVRAALGILGFTGSLVVYSAINAKFKVPQEAWAVATVAAAYYFSTASKKRRNGDEDDADDRSE
jgi:hypothetical protein